MPNGLPNFAKTLPNDFKRFSFLGYIVLSTCLRRLSDTRMPSWNEGYETVGARQHSCAISEWRICNGWGQTPVKYFTQLPQSRAGHPARKLLQSPKKETKSVSQCPQTRGITSMILRTFCAALPIWRPEQVVSSIARYPSGVVRTQMILVVIRYSGEEDCTCPSLKALIHCANSH
jgi:hypothetical protein